MSAPDHPGEKLSAYLDDELSPAERAAVDQHLGECAACAQLLEELAAVDSASRNLPVRAPEGYFDAFPARVRERLAARRSRHIPAWTWAAAAAVLLAVLTPLTLRDRPQAPAGAEMKPPVRTPAGDRPAPEESSSRAQPAAAPAAAATPAAPTTLAAEVQDRLKALGYVGGVGTPPEAKPGDLRQKRDTARDDRLKERDTDARASAFGGRAGPGRRGADLKDAELKKEAFGEKAGADRPQQNAAPPPASVPATALPESVVAAESRQLATRADEAAPKARAEPPAAQGYAAKPSPAEGALRATKAAGAPARTASADEAGVAREFEALAARPLTKAEDARTAARQWGELARRHPQAKAADEARVRAIEALATAFRLERTHADRDQARQAAQAYLAANGPQKDRVRAVLDQLAR